MLCIPDSCITIAANNNRIMIAYRLFSPNCPNFVSGNHRIQTLQLTEQIIDIKKAYAIVVRVSF